ncbi:restriction endonuclease subunit S [Streptomyces sp. 021-4]|uniref:restriction endonuclease subunit S n=1 Tax=Streptomyces sp. 021-4 TaxID=2789260 RepID=UPI0039F45173
MSVETWQRFRLADVLTDVFAGAWGDSPTDKRAANVQVLRATNIDSDGRIDYRSPAHRVFASQDISRKRLQVGDLLLEASGGGPGTPVGRVALHVGADSEIVFACSNFFRAMRPNRNVILPGYLACVLERLYRSPEIWRYQQQTTGLVNLKFRDYLNQWLLIPPLREQQRIVELINVLSDAKRGIEASIAKLRDVRRGAVLTCLASVSANHPPKGWVRTPLRDVVPMAEYGISEALNRDGRGTPVLRMNNVRNGRIDSRELRYCPAPVPQQLYLRYGDVLFNRTNSIDHVGKAAMWRDELPSTTFASYLVRLNPDCSRMSPEYLVEWLMHPAIRQRVRSISTVAVQQVNVNPSRLRELEIDYPADLPEQRRIVSALESCDEQIAQEEGELTKLRELKVGLVDDLLSGRVAVSVTEG